VIKKMLSCNKIGSANVESANIEEYNKMEGENNSIRKQLQM